MGRRGPNVLNGLVLTNKAYELRLEIHRVAVSMMAKGTTVLAPKVHTTYTVSTSGRLVRVGGGETPCKSRSGANFEDGALGTEKPHIQASRR
jgi:hypothetical protein